MVSESRNVVVIHRSYWPVSVLGSLIHGNANDIWRPRVSLRRIISDSSPTSLKIPASQRHGVGRWFACRGCYRLGYRARRGGRMDRAHCRLARPHRKLNADYDGPTVPRLRRRNGCAGGLTNELPANRGRAGPPPPRLRGRRTGILKRLNRPEERGRRRR